jgi:hypothetical protein
MADKRACFSQQVIANSPKFLWHTAFFVVMHGVWQNFSCYPGFVHLDV